jgi:hypothetical protein
MKPGLDGCCIGGPGAKPSPRRARLSIADARERLGGGAIRDSLDGRRSAPAKGRPVAWSALREGRRPD